MIYAVNVAEVRLPLSDRQLSLVDVPGRMSSGNVAELPEVIFSEEYAGKTYTWKGHVVRAEGGVDERNRLLYLVAQVPDPYGVDPSQPGRPELVAGSFVEAAIAGRHFERIYPIPRRALRNGNQVWVVGDDGRLDKRDIGVLYKAKDMIYVTTGIDDGDQVVLSQLDVAVKVMRVRVQQEGSHEELEEARKDSNPFAGRTPVEAAIRDVVTTTDRGATLNIPPEKALDLASKAKEYVDNMKPEQKQQIKESAQKIAEQLRTMQQNLAPATTASITKPAQPASQMPAAKTEDKVEEPKVEPAVEAPVSEGSMSPLAAQLEADLAAQSQAPEPEAVEQPKPQQAAPTQPAPELLADSDKGARTHVISTVVAPKPLLEASQ